MTFCDYRYDLAGGLFPPVDFQGTLQAYHIRQCFIFRTRALDKGDLSTHCSPYPCIDEPSFLGHQFGTLLETSASSTSQKGQIPRASLGSCQMSRAPRRANALLALPGRGHICTWLDYVKSTEGEHPMVARGRWSFQGHTRAHLLWLKRSMLTPRMTRRKARRRPRFRR